MEGAVKHWNKLLREAVELLPLEPLKKTHVELFKKTHVV